MQAGFFPQQVAITAYGNGGFRFGGMSHIGALLALPDGMKSWDVTSDASRIAAADFDAVFASLAPPAVLLFGTGPASVTIDFELRSAFQERGITFEVMSTGAAARTFNVLLAEGRNIGAALLAVP